MISLSTMSLLKKGESTGREELGMKQERFSSVSETTGCFGRGGQFFSLRESPSGDFNEIIISLRSNMISCVIKPSRVDFSSKNKLSRLEIGYLMDRKQKLLSLMWRKTLCYIEKLMKKSCTYHVYYIYVIDINWTTFFCQLS